MNRITFFICAVLVLSACSGSRPTFNTDADVPEGFPNHSIDDIHANLNRLAIPVEAYKAESSLSIKTPARSGSFNASISHKKDDSLMITISMMGIQGVKTLITPDSFYVHDRINKELTLGGIEKLQRILPLPVTSETLYASMLGLLQPETMTSLELSADSRYYTLLFSEQNKKFMIDPAYWRIVRYEERDDDGSLVEERTFSEFDDIEGVYLPRRLTFRRPGDDMSASIYYRDININPRSISFDFEVNPSVERIIIQ